MPIIFVYTKTENPNMAKEFELKLREKHIDNSFIKTRAKDIPKYGGGVLKSFGKEELIEKTLKKCTEALESDMLKIMMKKISNNLKNKLFQENEKFLNEIIDKTRNDFIQNYNEFLNESFRGQALPPSCLSYP